jgi:predicted anti-sigma-YlaC factor YlaD
MKQEHVAVAELELYVMGALDEVRAARVEEHAGACAACGEALAREARLEMAFEQIAERMSHPPAVATVRALPKRRPMVTVGYAFAGAAAMAAGVLLWVGRVTIDRHPAGGAAVGAPAIDGAPAHVAPLEDAANSTASFDAMRTRDELDGG